VVNRWAKNIDVELHKVEAHLDEQLLGLIPNDYRKVIDSINLGRPLVETEPSSKITIEIKRIAGMIERNDETVSPQPRKRLLGSVFGRGSSTTGVELAAMPDTA
jgi:pilus assembly protein CpaE